MSLRSYLELAYFAAGVVLAVTALYGLKQIYLLKRDIATRNERAAKEKAIEYSSRYLKDFVTLIDTCAEACRQAHVPSTYSGPIGDFNPESLSQGALAEGAKRFHAARWHLALNELEVVAAAFMSGVADEALGFSMIGGTFCASVQGSYDIVTMMAPKKEGKFYRNIISLYNVWAPRLTEAELELARADIAQRLTELPKAAAIKGIGED